MGSLDKTWNVCSMKFEMTSLGLSIGVILVYEITKSVVSKKKKKSWIENWMVELLEIGAYPWKFGENFKSELRMY